MVTKRTTKPKTTKPAETTQAPALPAPVVEVLAARGIPLDTVRWVKLQGSSIAVAHYEHDVVVGSTLALTDEQLDALLEAGLTEVSLDA